MHPMLQPINICHYRTFQVASSEPLGDDWGDSEAQALIKARAESAAVIKRTQSNADPDVARLRQNLAAVERVMISLPAGGEKRADLLQQSEDWRRSAASLAADVELPRTAVRGQKIQRRQKSRSQFGRQDTDRVVKALLSRKKRNRAALIQQGEAPADPCSDYRPLAKKGRQRKKVCTAWLQVPCMHACPAMAVEMHVYQPASDAMYLHV